MAKKIYSQIINKVIIIISNIDYDLFLDIALSTACRAIDSFYIATVDLIDGILVSADKIMINNAKKYGVEAYYIHEPKDYETLVSRLKRL